MSHKMITTCFAMLVFAGFFLAAGCGGGDSSPTTPPTPQPPTPPPPPPPPPTVSQIEVSPATVSLEVGKTQRFVATAKASDGSVISGVNFTWASSNTGVATINAGGVATAVSAGTATIRATGNGILSQPATITVTVAPVTRVTIAPSAAQDIMVGEMVTFTATARTAGGTARDDVSVSWASSDTSVVSITSAGVATAVGAGSAMIRATAAGVMSSPVTINVTEPPPPEPVVATVTVSPAEATIEEGETQQFDAMATTSDGTAVPDAEFAWSSSDTLVATVDENGLATGVGAGEVMITATADSVSGAAMLTVTEAPLTVATVTVSPAEATIEEGETQQFDAMATTSDGTAVPDAEFTWTSSDEMVATIDSDGLARGAGEGEVMITATADGVTGTATLTVTGPPPPPPPPPPPMLATVTVIPAEASIEEGQTQQFEAMAATADGMAIPDLEFTWESSDEMVATVDSNGLATGVGAGQVMITATADNVSGMAILTITEPPPPMVSTVTLTPTEATIEVGQEYSFEAIALAADGNEITDAEFMWSSSDTLVATVDENGLATGVGAGQVMIIAMADSVSGMATLTVNEPPPPPPPPPMVSTVSVSPSEATIEEGQTQQFEAMAATADSMAVPDLEFTWESSDEMVASIDSNGLATAIRAGQVMITATADNVTGMAMLTVTEPPPEVERVEVTPSAASIEEGDTRRFTARAYDSDNDRITGKTFTWTSSNTSVATVNPSSGTATTASGVNAGSTTIRATVDGVTGTATLRVTEPPPVVNRVTVSPASASIEEGNTRRFTATARESDGTLISGKTFTWTSTNTSVATVNPSSGTATTATGVNAGSTTIRATVDGVTGTASLTVTAPPPPPPPSLKRRTATISGTPNYPSTAGSVTFEEVAGGQLKLTITGMNTGGGIQAHLFLYTSASINWRSGSAPVGARHFGNVTRQPGFTRTFTPRAGETIDSYSYVILHCAAVNMPLGSGSLSN